MGIDIFTGKKHDDLCPSTHNMEVPIVERKDYTVTTYFLQPKDAKIVADLACSILICFSKAIPLRTCLKKYIYIYCLIATSN